MTKLSPKRVLLVLTLLAAVAFAAVALRPRPVAVEIARAARGPLRVTVDEEGETRVRHRYVIGAPVAGRLERIALDEGDAVAAGQVVARLDPAPLDARGRDMAAARLAAARAAQREAEALAGRERASLAEARRQLARAERLGAATVISREALDAARTAARTAEGDLAAATFRARAAAYDVLGARAALLESPPGAAAGGQAIQLRSPVAGRVLRVNQEWEKVVPAGADLIEIGDPRDLEVVVDVLSSDALQVRPGAPMRLDPGTGGEIPARVRAVEPSGFTKVSPLGIEEQRVNVIGDLVDPPGRLGDRYRVEAHIVLWEGADVLKVPAGALFRRGESWAVFLVRGGRARLRELAVGRRNPDEAEVLRGLAPGEEVVVHPSDAVADGVRVAPLATAR